MIKNWIQFIKESNHHWLETDDVKDAFISLQDEGYSISVNKAIFLADDKITWLNPQDDIISLTPEYYFGFQILIEKSRENITHMFMVKNDWQLNLAYLYRLSIE